MLLWLGFLFKTLLWLWILKSRRKLQIDLHGAFRFMPNTGLQRATSLKELFVNTASLAWGNICRIALPSIETQRAKQDIPQGLPLLSQHSLISLHYWSLLKSCVTGQLDVAWGNISTPCSSSPIKINRKSRIRLYVFVYQTCSKHHQSILIQVTDKKKH